MGGGGRDCFKLNKIISHLSKACIYSNFSIATATDIKSFNEPLRLTPAVGIMVSENIF